MLPPDCSSCYKPSTFARLRYRDFALSLHLSGLVWVDLIATHQLSLVDQFSTIEALGLFHPGLVSPQAIHLPRSDYYFQRAVVFLHRAKVLVWDLLRVAWTHTTRVGTWDPVPLCFPSRCSSMYVFTRVSCVYLRCTSFENHTKPNKQGWYNHIGKNGLQYLVHEANVFSYLPQACI